MQHKRPKMTLLQRAKQFMPFAALKGFQELLEETARYTENRKELSEEQLEELDRQLYSMVRGQRVRVIYYTGRYYHQVEGVLDAINPVHRTIKVQGQQIPLSQITQLSSLD